MGFEVSEKVQALNARLAAFMLGHIYPREHDWQQDSLIPDVFTHARFCRIADGPDKVHMSQLDKLTIRELVK